MHQIVIEGLFFPKFLLHSIISVKNIDSEQNIFSPVFLASPCTFDRMLFSRR